MESLDIQLLRWSNLIRHPVLDWFFTTITWAGSLYVQVPIAIAVGICLFQREHKHEICFFSIGFGGTVMLTYLLKGAIARPRPDFYPTVIPMPTSLSMPSAHTAQITAFYLCLWVIAKRISPGRFRFAGAIGALLVVCVGYSRVYLQVHFPSDVAAGILIAIIWSMGTAIQMGTLRRKNG